MANRLKVPNTRPANRESVGRGLPETKTPLPRYSIGRSLVSKRAINEANKSDENPTGILGFLKEIGENKSNSKVGRVALHSEMFITYIDSYQMNTMLEGFLANTKGARRKETRCKRAVSNLRELFRKVQIEDGEMSQVDLGNRTYKSSMFEGDEDLYMPVVDPGPFKDWGEIPVGFKKQPAMISDHVVGLNIDVSDELVDDYRRVARLLGNNGLDTSIMKVEDWEPTVVIFRTNDKIPSQNSIDRISIPAPPEHIPALPFTIRSHQ